jgi:hypothetical protein
VQQKLKRSDFIKLTLLGSVGACLNSCGAGTHEKSKKISTPGILKNDATTKVNLETATKPTFKLYQRSDPEYNILRKGFNKRIDKFPNAIAECKSTGEVAQAVSFAISNNLPVSIKSGGHSFEGFSCNDDGLVINLSSMNEVKWESDTVISAGPGCKLSSLYNTVLSKNKLLPGGSCGSVGIGGLTLGGGYGLFSRAYGLTCDSLIEITMVDGKGNVISSAGDAELLWACKGGGNGNFGVITSMKFNLMPAPELMQSSRFTIRRSDKKRAVNVLQNWFDITQSLPDSCFSSFVLNGKSLYILLTCCNPQSNGSQTIINSLSTLVDKTTIGNPEPLLKAVKVFYGVQNPIYFKNSSAGFYDNFDDIKNCIEDVVAKVIATPGMIYQINTLGGKIKDAEFTRQSSYSHRQKNYLAELQTYWDNAEQTEPMIKAFHETQHIFYKNGIKSQYSNYPDINLPDWESAYFGENYNRLQKIKGKYDLQNLFRYEQSIKNSGR